MIIFVVNVYYVYFSFVTVPAITRSCVLLPKRSSGEKKC